VAIPEMGTPEMQSHKGLAIGVIPKPETRGTERRRSDREVFGEIPKRCQ